MGLILYSTEDDARLFLEARGFTQGPKGVYSFGNNRAKIYKVRKDEKNAEKKLHQHDCYHICSWNVKTWSRDSKKVFEDYYDRVAGRQRDRIIVKKNEQLELVE